MLLDATAVARLAAEREEKANKPPKFTDVPSGPELMRVLGLPRRPVPDAGGAEALDLASFLTKALAKRPDPYPGSILPTQALALQEAWLCRGLFAPIRVGGGKTLLSYLLPSVLKAKRPLYVCPASMKPDVLAEFVQYQDSWRGPRVSTYPIVSYELLSSPAQAEDRGQDGNVRRHALLERLAPDLIVLDESHRAANSGATVTKRLKAYLLAHPETVVVAMTGTMFKTSIKDAAHVAQWCLGDGAPLPHDFLEREAWASYLDAKKSFGAPFGVGALVAFLVPNEALHFDTLSEKQQKATIRRAVARRILETPGVIGTQDPPLDTRLTVDAYYPPREDPDVEQAFADLRASWCMPDGTELTDGFEYARHCRTIGRGFWKRWEPAPPETWRAARNDWAKLCRHVIKHNRMGLDSEARVKDYIRKGLVRDDGLLEAWETERDTERVRTGLREPPSVAVWVSDEAVHAVSAWIAEHHGLVWVEDICLGERLAQELNISYYGAESLDAKGRHIKRHPPGTPAVASIAANGTGKNLQKIWASNLWLCVPGEQSLGRTHRAGQQAKTVKNFVYLGCSEHLQTFYRARDEKAQFAEDLTLSPQRLVYADVCLPTVDELDQKGGVRWAKKS